MYIVKVKIGKTNKTKIRVSKIKNWLIAALNRTLRFQQAALFSPSPLHCYPFPCKKLFRMPKLAPYWSTITTDVLFWNDDASFPAPPECAAPIAPFTREPKATATKWAVARADPVCKACWATIAQHPSFIGTTEAFPVADHPEMDECWDPGTKTAAECSIFGSHFWNGNPVLHSFAFGNSARANYHHEKLKRDKSPPV